MSKNTQNDDDDIFENDDDYIAQYTLNKFNYHKSNKYWVGVGKNEFESSKKDNTWVTENKNFASYPICDVNTYAEYYSAGNVVMAVYNHSPEEAEEKEANANFEEEERINEEYNNIKQYGTVNDMLTYEREVALNEEKKKAAAAAAKKKSGKKQSTDKTQSPCHTIIFYPNFDVVVRPFEKLIKEDLTNVYTNALLSFTLKREENATIKKYNKNQSISDKIKSFQELLKKKTKIK